MADRLTSAVMRAVRASEWIYDISAAAKVAILLSPVVIVLACGVLLLLRTTRAAMIWMLEENHPVELLTFVFLLGGGILGIVTAVEARRRGETALVYGFYFVFSTGLLLTSMDEIAWGQWFLGFETPQAWRAINLQGEMTLHNVGPLQDKTEVLRLAFGLGGLVGVGLSFYTPFRSIGASVLLLPWFLIISGHAAVDLYNDFFPIEAHFDFYMNRTSELIELLIGMAGTLYVYLNRRMLGRRAGHVPNPD